jgi:hypothetical protein
VNWRDEVRPDTITSAITDAIIAGPAEVQIPLQDSPARAQTLFLGGGDEDAVVTLVEGSELSLGDGLEFFSGGVLQGDGVLALQGNPLVVAAGAELRVAGGERLVIQSGAVSNRGSIEISGRAPLLAEMAFGAEVINEAGTGLISGTQAVLRFPQGLRNHGAMEFGGGFNEVRGEVSNESGGRILLSGGATVVFYDDVSNAGAINASAAGGLQSSVVFFGDFSGNGVAGAGAVFIVGDARPGFGPGIMEFGGDLGYGPFASMEMELGGTAAGTQYDHIMVAGDLVIGGSLKMTLLSGFVPAAGMVFDLWEASSVSGQFASVDLPPLPAGLFWHSADVDTNGELRVSVAPEGYPAYQRYYALSTPPNGDEDGDGLENLLEFLTGGNPREVDSVGAMPILEQTENEDRYSFMLTDPPAPDVLVEVESSTNLREDGPGGWEVIASRSGNGSWSGSAGVVVRPAGDGRLQVSASRPASPEVRRFYRLKATLLP